jgi:hypothetical protein
MRFVVLAAVKISVFVFRGGTPGGSVRIFQCFGRVRYFHLHNSSALKMEAVCPSETLVSIYKSTWRYNPEDKHEKDEVQIEL